MPILNNSNKKNNVVSSVAILDENNLKSEKEIVQRKQKVKPSFSSITPIIDVTSNGFFVMNNGEYMDFFQITSKDIYSLNSDDRYSDMDNLANYLLAYTGDNKWIPLNVRLNLEVQKRYINRKIRKNKSPVYRHILEQRLNELKQLEKERTNREYFLFIFEEDEGKLIEKKAQVKYLFQRSNPLKELTMEKKYNILFQLFNPNTKPLSENE